MQGLVLTPADFTDDWYAQGDAYINPEKMKSWIYDGTTFISGGPIHTR